LLMREKLASQQRELAAGEDRAKLLS